MFLPQRLPGQDWLGVVVAIPEPWVTQLTDLRLRLGDLAGSRIPAHITLMPPTPVAREARAEVIDHLRSIASRHSPFRVTLSGTDSFRPVSNVAFMTLAEGASDCTDLAEEIRSQLDAHGARVVIVWEKGVGLVTDPGPASHADGDALQGRTVFSVDLSAAMPVRLRAALRLPVERARRQRPGPAWRGGGGRLRAG